METITYCLDIGPLSDKGIMSSILDTIPVHCKNKLNTIHSNTSKIQILGEYVLLTKVAEDFGFELERCSLYHDKFGKPSISNLDANLSLSHDGERVICSISELSIGCDVQKTVLVDCSYFISFLHRDEYDVVVSMNDPFSRSNTLCRIWSLKESYSKLIGKGMCLPLNSFSVINAEGNVSMDSVFFKEYDMADGYHYAICAESNNYQESMKLIHLSDFF